MGSESLNVFTLMFLVPGILLAVFLYFAFRNGTTRIAILDDLLIRQYGRRKGRLVTILFIVLFLLGAWGIAFMRRGMLWGLTGALK
jgi:hypothetical protein